MLTVFCGSKCYKINTCWWQWQKSKISKNQIISC